MFNISLLGTYLFQAGLGGGGGVDREEKGLIQKGKMVVSVLHKE